MAADEVREGGAGAKALEPCPWGVEGPQEGLSKGGNDCDGLGFAW